MKMKNEFEARDELIEKRKNLNTLEELKNYVKDIEKNYNYDYEVAPRAIAQGALAVAWYLEQEMGITGFQASFVMWDFIIGWQFRYNKCGLKQIDYDEMLYPQYEDKFEKVISENTWKKLQEQADVNLKKNPSAHPEVIEHWKNIVAGNVPFGYKVKEN